MRLAPASAAPPPRPEICLESEKAVRAKVCPGLGRTVFFELAASKVIPSYRVGRRLLFDAEEVRSALARFRNA